MIEINQAYTGLFRITGNVVVDWIDSEGNANKQRIPNLVIDSGLNLMRDRIAGTSSSFVSHFAVGTSNTPVTAVQTAMGNEVFRDVLTSTITTTSKAVRFEYYLPSGAANGNTITEIGLFSASTGPTMVARAILATSIIKSSLVTATFQWTITFSAT